MNHQSKKKQYLNHLDGWALPIIKNVVRKYQRQHQSRLPEDELIHEAFVFYRERCINKLKNVDEGLLRHVTMRHILTYVLVNEQALTIPGGTLTKKGGMEKVKETLASLRDEELFFKESAVKDLKIDYETLIATLPSPDKIAMASIYLGHSRKFTTELLKGLGYKNSREVMEKAVLRIVKGFSEAGYP